MELLLSSFIPKCFSKMRHTLIYTILISVSFFSCQENQPEIDILKEEDRVVDILTDMYIAEATLNKQHVGVRDSLTNVYRDNIILIHKLTEQEFDTLIWLIQTDVENYGDIHKKVLDRLTELNDSQDKT